LGSKSSRIWSILYASKILCFSSFPSHTTRYVLHAALILLWQISHFSTIPSLEKSDTLHTNLCTKSPVQEWTPIKFVILQSQQTLSSLYGNNEPRCPTNTQKLVSRNTDYIKLFEVRPVLLQSYMCLGIAFEN